MKNKSILLAGTNVSLGKEAARQLALIKEPENYILHAEAVHTFLK